MNINLIYTITTLNDCLSKYCKGHLFHFRTD